MINVDAWLASLIFIGLISYITWILSTARSLKKLILISEGIMFIVALLILWRVFKLNFDFVCFGGGNFSKTEEELFRSLSLDRSRIHYFEGDQLDLNYFSVEADPINIDELTGKTKGLIPQKIVNESNYYKNLLLKLDKVSQIITH